MTTVPRCALPRTRDRRTMYGGVREEMSVSDPSKIAIVSKTIIAVGFVGKNEAFGFAKPKILQTIDGPPSSVCDRFRPKAL